MRTLLRGAAGFAVLTSTALGSSPGVDPGTRSAGPQHVVERTAAASLPLLTEIRAIRALSLDEGARGYPVRITGIVTHFDESLANGLIVSESGFGQFIEPPPPSARIPVWHDIRTGDVVEIEGRTIRGGFAPNVVPERLRTLGHGPLPQAKRIPYATLITGRHDCEYIDVDGVIQRAWLSTSPTQHTMFADVAFEDGVLRAAFWSYAPADLDRFIDARVHLRGNVGAIFGPTEQLRGVSLFAGRTSDIQILEPAPDPFSLPVRPIRNVYNYSSGDVNHRIHVRGVVVGRVPGRPVHAMDFSTASMFRYMHHVLYVADATGGARIETKQSPDVHAGDVVEVAGFPAVSPGKPILRNAVFRVVGTTSGPAAVTLPSENVLNADNDAALVCFDAQLLGALTTPNEHVVVLKTRTGDTAFEAGLDQSDGQGFNNLTPGSLIRVTGVYAYLPGPPPSFRLFLRSPNDVVVLSEPPWWTLRHTVVMASMLALLAAIGWIWLKTFANRKRRAYQAVLTERNRVARELHDTLEQALTGITLQLEAVAGTIQTSPGTASQSLDVAQQMLRYSLEETRRSVMDLRSQALESRDLPGALEDLARQMTLGTPMIAKVFVTGAPRRLDAAQEHHLLRIGLEALTNAVKHGAPGRIDIELRFEPDATTLVVADDGRGCRDGVEGEISGNHFGLLGIRERVTKLGGVLDIQSGPGKGTRLSVVVPARAHEHGQTLVHPAAEVLHG